MEKNIHVSHKGQGAATDREKGQGVTRTRAGTAPCKNGLARTLLIQNLQQVLPTKFRFIWQSSFRDFQKSTNLKQELPVVAMFVNGSKRNEQSLQMTFHRCFLPSFDSFGKAVSEEKIFRNRPIRNKNCLWWPCLLMDQDEMSNLYRGLPIDASYQVSVHLAKRFQKRRILKISQSETRVACGGHVC